MKLCETDCDNGINAVAFYIVNLSVDFYFPG